MAGKAQGCTLPDLPEEILQLISVHFKASEWAKGPSLACRRLNQLLLPRMALQYSNEEVAKKRARYAADGPRVSQGFLKWASKRVGLVTTTLSVSFEVYENLHITAAGNPLINAFSPATRLQNLRCFEQHHNFYRHIPTNAFCDWLLEHAPSLEACSLGNKGSFLAASTLVFHNLKHLELKTGYIHNGWENAYFKPAKQLPNLESLCMEGECTTHFEVFDVAGCLHLRILAINGALAEVVLKPEFCQVSFAPQDRWENGELGCLEFEEWLGKACPLLGVADQITLLEDFVSSQAARAGRFELFPCMSMLKLSWPDRKSDRNLSDTEESDSSNSYGQNEDYSMLLKNSMPIDGSPLLNLKVFIIMAKGSMKVCIPAELPHLEELVIMACGQSELSFKEPIATLLRAQDLLCLGPACCAKWP